MQPPVRGKTLGLDPGYRNGCKGARWWMPPVGCWIPVVIYPAPPFEKKVEQAKRQVAQWIRRHGVQVLAIGNGTASRETEKFAAEVIRELGTACPIWWSVKPGPPSTPPPAGGQGIPRLRCQSPVRCFHRPAAAGPFGRAGQD